MKSFRQRATKACSSCRQRKVRCDALTLGQPCTRCRQDGQKCVVQKRLPVGTIAGKQQSSPVGLVAPSLTQIYGQDKAGFSPEPTWENHISIELCPFLELESLSTLSPEARVFLGARGCLQIPAPTLIEEFIRQYFLHIQPCTPVIDESEFWSLYRQGPQARPAFKLSLLLFQAMLFASSPYISLETAQACGFENKRTAWNTLYERAKTLFQFQPKGEPLVRAQTAILLTFHASTNDFQSASLWLSHAIQAATATTPEKKASQINKQRDKEHSLHNRLWWSILIRDRSLCLALRRRAQVLTFELRMITDLPDEDSLKDEIHGSQVYSPDTKRVLFAIFREQCQMALLLTEMVSIVFETHGLSLPSFISCDCFWSRLAILQKIRTSMRLWRENLPLSFFKNLDHQNTVVDFVYLTMIYYETARMDLAHYEALLIVSHRDFMGPVYIEQLSHTGNVLYDASTKLITILQYFSGKDKAQGLPLAVVGYVAMPLVLSAVNYKLSPTEETMSTRLRVLECFWELFSYSRQVYEVTDLVSTRADDILQLAYLVSEEVFLCEYPGPPLPASDQPSIEARGQNKDPQCIRADLQLKPRTVNNWHDAFLQHTRGYLLLSTTVDHFMSVGRLPGDNSLPELVCFMPPFGRVRLPWSSEQHQAKCQRDPKVLAQTVNCSDHDPPVPEVLDATASTNWNEFDSALEAEELEQAEMWKLAELSMSYDTYISGLAHECFGSAPLQ